MKALVCGRCHDVRALRSAGPVTCECGNVQGWWADPKAGLAKFYAKDRQKAKAMGIHNGLIALAFKQSDFSPEEWRENHEILTSDEFSEGHVFNRKLRNCPVAVVLIGETSDTSWSDSPHSATVKPPIEEFEGALKLVLEMIDRLAGAHAQDAIDLATKIETGLRGLGWRG